MKYPFPRDTKNGGPIHWIHENYMCPGDLTDSCYQDTDGGFCKADSVSIEDDPEVNLKIFTIQEIIYGKPGLQGCPHLRF